MREIERFIELCGGQAAAQKALNISSGYISLLKHGKRAPSPEMALKIEQISGGRIKKERLVWPGDG